MPQRKSTQGLHPGDAAGSTEDAELSRLAAKFQEKHHRHLDLVENQQRVAGELPREDQEEVLSLMQAKAELAEAIADLRATTVVGLQAKAAVLLAYIQYDSEGQVHWTDHDELMGWSIARDLLGDGAARPSEVRNGHLPRS
jgi:hypothetical protein